MFKILNIVFYFVNSLIYFFKMILGENKNLIYNLILFIYLI